MSLLVSSISPIFALVASSRFFAPTVTNALIQLVWFAVSVHIPALMTGRMSYVDIAWPWGLVIIGLLPVFHPNSNMSWYPLNRANLISGAYLLAGLRMGLGAIRLLREGHLNEEMNRYLFQRRRWAERGITDENSIRYKLEMQKEIFIQCLANIGILIVPMMLQGFGYLGPDTSLTKIEIFGWLMWISGLVFEHTGDVQKKKFISTCKKDGIRGAVCNIGLWNYTRHPNYFGEWLVWTSLVVTSIPSLMAMWNTEEDNILIKVVLSLSLFLVSYSMYDCLVYYTGATPAEFYSVKSRPKYADYQKSVNMFFPGPRKNV
jgi:steroid 5-alpha reductase family enzyme